MSKILFVLNGPLSIIAAINIATLKFRGSATGIIYELPKASALNKNFRKPMNGYAEVCSFFLGMIVADFVMPLEIERYHTTIFRNPLLYKYESNSIEKSIEVLIDNMPWQPDKIIYSGNSVCHRFFFNKDIEFIAIEHGIGDYIFKNSPIDLVKGWVRNLLFFFLKIPGLKSPNLVYLSDNGRCIRLNYGKNSFQRLPPPNLQVISNEFLDKLGASNKVKLEKIHDLMDWCNLYEKVYIYLPTETISKENYLAYLTKQLSVLDLNNACFIVKPHPIDSLDYSEFFSALNLDHMLINDIFLKYVPAEIYLSLISRGIALGAGSSSLFYSYWWLNKLPIISGNCSNDSVDLIKFNKYFNSDIVSIQKKSFAVYGGLFLK